MQLNAFFSSLRFEKSALEHQQSWHSSILEFAIAAVGTQTGESTVNTFPVLKIPHNFLLLICGAGMFPEARR
jgi:hypothetical protein